MHKTMTFDDLVLIGICAVKGVVNIFLSMSRAANVLKKLILCLFYIFIEVE